MDKLKEYIKQLAREVMSEESATGAICVGAGPIMTPAAFAPKGQDNSSIPSRKQPRRIYYDTRDIRRKISRRRRTIQKLIKNNTE